MQELVSWDVAASHVTNVLQYPYGILSAISPYRNASSGRDLLLALQWPAIAGGGDGLTPSLVVIDPTASTWAPRVLWKFDDRSLPMPGCMAVDVNAAESAVYAVLQENASPPEFQGQHVLRLDLATLKVTQAWFGADTLFDPPFFTSCFIRN